MLERVVAERGVTAQAAAPGDSTPPGAGGRSQCVTNLRLVSPA